jgi:CubicO group peptidase (beta-lactamase class C family)
MRRYVDGDLLAGVSSAVLVGRNVVDLHCEGWADREAQVRLREDHVFRAFSNTKLLTTCATMLLIEAGRFGLDDPVERYLPQLADRQVLRPGATSLSDVEPARSSITLRQLLSHSSGLSYGLLDPGTLIYDAYRKAQVLNPATPLTDMIDRLATLPLVFHPGTSWEYSVATDVLGRIIEVASGERFDAFLPKYILDPLDMKDTGFVVPAESGQRLVAYYRGADPVKLMQPGLSRIDQLPYPGAYRTPVPRLSGGGGLVSTLPDMIALIRSLTPGGPNCSSPRPWR